MPLIRRRLVVAGALAAILLVTVLAVRATLGRQSARASVLAAAGLPGDLDQYVGQLRHLQLPDHAFEQLPDLSWLGSKLPGLSIGRLSAESIRKLPHSLRILQVREARDLPSLAGLPPDLESLEVELASIADPSPLPFSLRRLLLSGELGFPIGRLPSNLTELSLRGAELRDLRGAPGTLTHVDLASRVVSSLDGIPEGARAVSLHRTYVSTLETLPPSLHALELSWNPLLDPLQNDDLPRFLVELTLDRQFVGQLTELPVGLRRLRISDCRGASALLGSLPETLSSLEVEGVAPPAGCWLPVDLRSLFWHLDHPLDPDCLPAGLEELHLTGAEPATVAALAAPLVRLGLVSPGTGDLDDYPILPESLRFLTLDYTLSDLSRLAAETPSLVSLRYRGFPAAALPELPESLQVLDLGGSRSLQSLGPLAERNQQLEVLLISGSEEFASLDQIPRSVRVLDISHTGISSLVGLPAGLEKLTISRGQVGSLEGLPAEVYELSIVD